MLVPEEVTLIRYKYPPYEWAFLVPVGDRCVEADIRPGTRRRLQKQYTVEVDTSQSGETFEILKLSEKIKDVHISEA